MNRRDFLAAAAAAAASSALPVRAATPRIKAIAFDGLALFDPRPIFALAESYFPQNGATFVATWRERQTDYTLLRTLTHSYADFLQVTEEALMFAADAEKLSITLAQRQQLMNAFLHMSAWPDVPVVLKTLRQQGFGLAPLTDFTVSMLEGAIHRSGLNGMFDYLLSTDLVRAYKPDSRAYQMALDAFGLDRTQIAFAAFAGWDAAGAKSFGYPTIWINRLAAPTERLALFADAVAPSLYAVPGFVGAG